jgi:Flp pilus assembly protein TadG
MSLVRRLKTTVLNFAADQSGQYAILFALCSGVIMISVALSVDYTRLISAKSQLTSALDAAVTSTARDITRGKFDKKEATRRVQAFLEANLDGKRLTKDNVHLTDVTVDPVTSKLSASARVDVDMMFPVMNNPKVQPVNVKIGALYSERKVEVSMVLDVTGSMGTNNKIGDLKIAAKSAVKSFLENGSANTRVAITPYAFGVNAGPLRSQVVAENGGPAKDACSSERRGPLMFSDASPVAAKVTRANVIATCPSVGLQPLTNDAKLLNGMIDKLQASGSTAGQIGLQWGWYLLSPNWRSVLPTPSIPVNYGTPDSEKYLILMTDGLFNSDGSGLTNSQIASFSGISQRSGRLAMSYCSAIKDKGVKLYTIGFNLKGITSVGERTEAIRMLTDCATTPTGSEQTFYNAENGADLKKAFDDIAAHIQTLRLTN